MGLGLGTHPPRVLIISNGNAEDLIGAALARQLGLPTLALPLVGNGRAYEGAAEAVLGPRATLPSGGFPFGSLANLAADLRAGLISTSLAQWRAARAAARAAAAVVVVGDAYALWVGVRAGRGRPLFHLQPLVSAYYVEGRSWFSRLRHLNQLGADDFTPFERHLQRYARAVYVRDAPSAARLQRLGVRTARFYGSFAMDVLPPPEQDLEPLRDGRPVLALLPGTRRDVAFSLPRMLEAAYRLDEFEAFVAWGLPLAALPACPGWRARQVREGVLRLERDGRHAWVMRGAFSAILHSAALALGTAGTANEQAAGLGVPILGFPTPGPQYTRAFAERQQRLLGAALTLCPPDPERIAAAARALWRDPEALERARTAGRARIGPPGALPRIATEVRQALLSPAALHG
ncbi:lipid-A-disaccharide synthase-related protein [Marinithermus hydrothermalis]|uniref:Lipid-A-disaccharide synthase n=1 Tax=Marinithermus hydrothermalis (strain DSM 14884 / JCM 11576 / T1) TaxID=869210 RepID=F2NQP3_MARHT|nr:lipid-A-disaccharide synthase-related protein [Marinithermus hydrothermalis]AEB11981.1 Conserved hypothetical protein CHP03492 [Marinithermus hydrothermalis DSM 14884]